MRGLKRDDVSGGVGTLGLRRGLMGRGCQKGRADPPPEHEALHESPQRCLKQELVSNTS